MEVRSLENLVRFSGVSKSFGKTVAVDNLSFIIPSGVIFGLLGPNGAGKTTTISMLSGLFPPDRGEIEVNGMSILGQEAQRAKASMGVVPQEIALYSTLSARENLHFWGRLYGLGGSKLKSRTDAVLQLVGLTERAGEAISTYSGGMKRRINIAAGLLHNPRLLLLDEPTVGVDPQSRRAILDTIKNLKTEGMTVLYTSHYMEEVSELCDLVSIMDEGRIIAQGTQAELHKLVGDRDLVQMEVDRALPDVSFLADIPGVHRVDSTETRIEVTLDDGSQGLPTLISEVTRRGARVNAVRIKEPDLEAVFLHLTGRTLRD